jgi:thioesterase domain-containing protein
LAVRLFAEIEKLVGRRFPLVTLFQAPTVAELAATLSQTDDALAHPLLVPIQPRGSKLPLFLIHGAGGDVLWGYANLAAHLPADQPIYGIKSRGQAGLEESSSVGDMAADYVQAIRALQPQGPYYLGGYCFGGNVAYEMARQLRRDGEEVALVALIDTAPANAGYERVTWWRPEFAWRFSRNLMLWLKDFADLPAEDRRRFVGRKLRALVRKLKGRLRFTRGSMPVDLEEIIDTTHFPAAELKLWQTHLDALVNHVDQSYDGQVLLLRTRGQPLFCSLAEDFCWGKLAHGGVRLHPIPGSHENIFIEPNVQELARTFSEAISTAQMEVTPR